MALDEYVSQIWLTLRLTGSRFSRRTGGTTRYAVLLFLGSRFPQEVVPSSEFLQVSTNIVAIANPLFSESTLEGYLLGKDDLMMNSQRYDHQYPVDGTLDIDSRAQRYQVESEQHRVAAEAVYAGSTERCVFLSESNTKRECPKARNCEREEHNPDAEQRYANPEKDIVFLK